MQQHYDVDYQNEIEIDQEHPTSKKQYHRVVTNWKRRCLEASLSTDALQKGGRTMRREIERREIKFSHVEIDDSLVHSCHVKDRCISQLTVTFLNFEPEEENDEGVLQETS